MVKRTTGRDSGSGVLLAILGLIAGFLGGFAVRSAQQSDEADRSTEQIAHLTRDVAAANVRVVGHQKRTDDAESILRKTQDQCEALTKAAEAEKLISGTAIQRAVEAERKLAAASVITTELNGEISALRTARISATVDRNRAVFELAEIKKRLGLDRAGAVFGTVISKGSVDAPDGSLVGRIDVLTPSGRIPIDLNDHQLFEALRVGDVVVFETDDRGVAKAGTLKRAL